MYGTLLFSMAFDLRKKERGLEMGLLFFLNFLTAVAQDVLVIRPIKVHATLDHPPLPSLPPPPPPTPPWLAPPPPTLPCLQVVFLATAVIALKRCVVSLVLACPGCCACLKGWADLQRMQMRQKRALGSARGSSMRASGIGAASGRSATFSSPTSAGGRGGGAGEVRGMIELTGWREDEENEERGVKVGDLVRIKSNRARAPLEGVVMFTGAVHFAKGQFLGVELLEYKGKHDGQHDNKRYFQCEAGRGLFCLEHHATVLVESEEGVDQSKGASASTADPAPGSTVGAADVAVELGTTIEFEVEEF